MQYLAIQNPGEAPVELFLILGVSTTRNHGTSRTIGQFGSGAKQAANLLLRKNLTPVIYCGRTRLEYGVDNASVSDGLNEQSYGEVYCRVKGRLDGKMVNRKEKLGFALEYGVHDWTEVAMALREYVSNAIDRTEREGFGFVDAIKDGQLSVEVVDEKQVRAKAGYTRVFVPYEGDVVKFHEELGRRFLHFSEPEMLDCKILTRRGRNLSDDVSGPRRSMIYKRGVFVREVKCAEGALFDYNFDSELTLDESRNVDDYRVRQAAGNALRDAEPKHIAKVFETIIEGQATWEASFDKYSMTASYVYDEEKKNSIKENWNEGWNAASGNGVLCRDEQHLVELVDKKGHKAVTLKNADGWFAVARENEVKDSSTVLTSHEREGRQIIDATPASTAAVDEVWKWVEECDLAMGKEKPPVKCFIDIVNAGSTTMGYYEDGVVYINEYHASDGIHKDLLDTALEEVVHYVTGATDMSRDFQSFLIKMLVNKFSK